MKTEVFDDEDFRAPDLRDYGRTLARHRKLIALTVVASIGVAILLSFVQSTTYKATTEVIIQPSGSQQLRDGSTQNSADAARDVANETAVLRSSVVRDAATKRLGHVPTVSISSDDVTSDVVTISAQSSSKVQAAKDANEYAKAYVLFRRRQSVDNLLQAAEQIQTNLDTINGKLPTLEPGSAELATARRQQALLQQQLDEVQVSANLNEVGGARVLAAAEVPNEPVSPKPLRNVAVGLILGLLLGIGLAFLREFLADKIASREDLERATGGLPVLGEIPSVEAWRKTTNQLVTLDPSTAEESAAEAYRTLRTSIQFLGIAKERRTIQFTSAEPGEGKTITAANVAVTFASAGYQVALVCCDLRRPRLHELFGLSNKTGFTSVLLGKVAVMNVLQVVAGHPNLAVLPAGPVAPNPSELLASVVAQKALATLAQEADLVLIDCTPVLPVSDALIVSGLADATVLVASGGRSTFRSIRRALELLRQVDAPLVGTVLNDAEMLSTTGYAAYTSESTNGTGPTKNEPVPTKGVPT